MATSPYRNTDPRLVTSKATIRLFLVIALLACFLPLAFSRFWDRDRKSVGFILITLPADGPPLTYKGPFVPLMKMGLVQRGKYHLYWTFSKLRGDSYPALSPTITLSGLVNIYRSVNNYSQSVLMPVGFAELTTCFPTNCLLTNSAVRLRRFSQEVEALLDYNGVVGIREGAFVKLVKKEWLPTNTVSTQITRMDTNGGSQMRAD